MSLTRTPAKRHGGIYTVQADAGTNMVIEIGTLAFDNSYPTGGEAITFSIPVANIVGFYAEPYGGRLYTYERSTEKIKAWFSRGGTASGVFAEVSSTSDLSAMSNVPYMVFGFA